MGKQKSKKPLSLGARKAQEIRDLTRGHAEWLAYKTWAEIETLISVAGVFQGSAKYDEIHSLWEEVQKKRGE